MSRAWSLVLCIACLVSSCKGTRDEDEEPASHSRLDDAGRVVLTAEERSALGLETVIAAEGRLTTNTLRFGKVVARPQEDALIIAPVTGRLNAPTMTLGAQVSAGDLLVSLEPLVDSASQATVAAQRRELQGQLEGARARVEAKRADLSRVTTLVTSGLATEADQAQAQAALTSEQARVDSLRRAGSELAHMSGGRMELRAPVPGVVAALVTDTGSLVQQGTILARLVRAGPRWIDVALPPGDPVGSGYRAHGITEVVIASLLTRGAVIQADGTRRDRLEAGPEAAASLPPGATVPIDVLHETQGVLVPTSALVRHGLETLVFVELDGGRYESHAVQVAARDEERAALSSGVAAGVHVVTRGASSLLGELGAAGGGLGSGAQE